MTNRSLSSLFPRLALLTFFSISSFFLFHKSRRLRQLRLLCTSNPDRNPNLISPPCRKPKLFFGSETGTSEDLARRLLSLLTAAGFDFDLVDPRTYEPEDLQKESLVLMVASTWEDGRPTPSAEFLSRWLSESAEDFRVGSMVLAGCKFAVFGVGSRSYGEERFNAAAKGFSKWMKALGAMEMVPLGIGDVDEGEVDEVFGKWSAEMVEFLKGGDVREKETRVIDYKNESWECDTEEEEEEEEVMESDVVDLEDIAGKGPTRKSSVIKTNGETNTEANGMREMVTPVLRTNLEKQVSMNLTTLRNDYFLNS